MMYACVYRCHSVYTEVSSVESVLSFHLHVGSDNQMLSNLTGPGRTVINQFWKKAKKTIQTRQREKSTENARVQNT